MEHSPFAFLSVTGTASFLALLVCIYGLRVLRRVRRVALSGKGPPSLGRLMSSQIWDSSIVQLSQGPDPLSLRGRSKEDAGDILAMASEKRKTAFWDRIFRRKARRVPKGVEPVWINQAADAARARDALRAQQVEQRMAQLQEMRKPGLKDVKALERAWQEEADCWGSNWDPGSLRWKAKTKWARD